MDLVVTIMNKLGLVTLYGFALFVLDNVYLSIVRQFVLPISDLSSRRQ